MKSKISLFIVVFATIISCKNESKTTTKNNLEPTKTEIKTISAMKKVMMGEDLSAHINWDTIPKEHLFAVCPLGRIQGEITIIDGKLFSSKVDDKNTILIENNWNISSPFAVYSYVKSWHEIEINETISNEQTLQKVIENAAKKIGISLEKPFVYKIEGSFDEVNYHIISKPLEEENHNHELHNNAKKHFQLKNVNGLLVGFYSQNHEGIFTHRGEYIHTHFIDVAEKNMGHLESLLITKKLKLYISK